MDFVEDYSQPHFYRFNQDSISLVNFAIGKLPEKVNSVADLCCGCGVIGLELSRNIEILKLSFYEIQQTYLPYLLRNINLFSLAKEHQIKVADAQLLNQYQKYDAILINPPYFHVKKSRPSKEIERRKARSYSEGFLEKILTYSIKSLNSGGSLFISFPKEGHLEKKLGSFNVRIDYRDIGKIRYYHLLKL